MHLLKEEVIKLLKTKIQSEYSKQLLGVDFVDYILNGIRAEVPSRKSFHKSIKVIIKSLITRFVKKYLRGKDKVVKSKVDSNFTNMLEIADYLSEGFDAVRVDLYCFDNSLSIR